MGCRNRYLSNLVFGNERGAFNLKNDLQDEGTIAADPKLVNYQPDGTGDYHLAAGSPAIGAGGALGAAPTDLDGVARPAGTPVDIGPYAYRPAGSRGMPSRSGARRQ